MAIDDPFSAFPDRLRASTERPSMLYLRRPGFFALHGSAPVPAGAAVILRLDDGITVCRGAPPAEAARQGVRLSPVYALSPEGPPAVPTGRVFVRFAEGVRADARRAALARAGFEVEEIPDYAPNAAWVSVPRGAIAASLRGVEALESLPDMVNVEPQMLAPSRRR